MVELSAVRLISEEIDAGRLISPLSDVWVWFGRNGEFETPILMLKRAARAFAGTTCDLWSNFTDTATKNDRLIILAVGYGLSVTEEGAIFRLRSAGIKISVVYESWLTEVARQLRDQTYHYDL